jgi:hypothetical protein
MLYAQTDASSPPVKLPYPPRRLCASSAVRRLSKCATVRFLASVLCSETVQAEGCENTGDAREAARAVMDDACDRPSMPMPAPILCLQHCCTADLRARPPPPPPLDHPQPPAQVRRAVTRHSRASSTAAHACAQQRTAFRTAPRLSSRCHRARAAQPTGGSGLHSVAGSQLVGLRMHARAPCLLDTPAHARWGRRCTHSHCLQFGVLATVRSRALFRASGCVSLHVSACVRACVCAACAVCGVSCLERTVGTADQNVVGAGERDRARRARLARNVDDAAVHSHSPSR